MIASEQCTLLLFLLLLPITSARAETVETVEFKNYVISPRSAHEIKPELMRNTPIRERSGSFNGHTDWRVDWQYQMKQAPDACHIQHIVTKIHVVHTLPVLSEAVTDKHTIEVFNAFSDALTQHEKNHGKHGLLAAREIDETLKTLQPQSDCHLLARLVDDIGNAVVQKYIFADNEYDRTTQNGRTEGAAIY